MDKCIMSNGKTIKSCDFTTNCPKRKKAELGIIENGIPVKPCAYCYVEASREIGFNAKIVIEQISYNGEVKRLTSKTVDKLNAVGGLRLFSFGDYIPEEHFDDIHLFLSDCREKGLKVKVITKVVQFVDDFYALYEDVFSIIHLSIDNIGDGVEHSLALRYKALYKKVIIRSVILNNDDLIALEPISDILTFNHANIKIEGKQVINYKLYPKTFNPLKEMYKDKVCCITGACATCEIKCKAWV